MTRGVQALPNALDLASRSKPGPRYTSYPPATCFTDHVGPAAVAAALEALPPGPISLYAHIPFCPSLCWYCGCNVEITRDRARARSYVDRLLAELDLIARHAVRPVAAVSLGGGSPNFLAPAELARLIEGIDRRMGLAADAELHVELDPRETSLSQVEALGALGFTRLSVGVQDFDPAVQKAIHRIQSLEQTAKLIGAARDAGFRSINCDLIYGLPLQTPETFRSTMERVLLLHPDRMALFGYAHVPHLRPAQLLVAGAGKLPGPIERAELLLGAFEQATAAGYVRIGIDHLALPEDELVRAAIDGTLDRNFQGYVVKKTGALLGIGASAISDLGDLYWQNHAELHTWETSVAAGAMPIARGVSLDPEDEVRRYVITRLMCDGEIRFAEVERRFGIDFGDHFLPELHALTRPEHVGLVEMEADRLATTALGTLLVRNVCMVFDTHLPADMGAPGRPRHSPTV